MKADAVAAAKLQIQEFERIAKMEVQYAEAKARQSAAVDPEVQAKAEAYAAKLAASIAKAKAAATENKLLWSTTFALPYSKWSVDSNTNLDWGKSTESYVSTQWIPAWWTKMMMDQAEGSASASMAASSSASSSSSFSSSGIPDSIDLKWTTATPTESSVWTGGKIFGENNKLITKVDVPVATKSGSAGW